MLALSSPLSSPPLLLASVISLVRVAGGDRNARKFAPDGHPTELVNLHGINGGFDEWKRVHWLPKLFANKGSGGSVRMDRTKMQNKAEITAYKSPSGNGYGYARLVDKSKKTMPPPRAMPTIAAKAKAAKVSPAK